jgi:hypothetical protein
MTFLDFSGRLWRKTRYQAASSGQAFDIIGDRI